MTCRLPRLAFGVSTSSTCEVTTAMPPPEIRATTVWSSNAQNRSIIAGFIAPMSVSLVGFLMFGNLLRECGCLERLSQTAQNDLANLITLLLGITISFSMQADQFVNLKTLIIMALGLVAFVFDSIAGVMFAKLLNLFCKNKVNPMVGAAGISAFPMSARVIQKMGQEADCTNHLLMHAVGANVAGQIASVLAGGMILNLVPQLMG